MKRIIFCGMMLLMHYSVLSQNMKIPFEISDGNKTSTYFEIIEFWQNLDKKSDKIQMIESV